MSRALFIAGVLVGLSLASVAIQSRATETGAIEWHAVATRTKASRREDGTWFQSRQETDTKLIDHGYRLGATGPIGRRGDTDFRWLAEWVELGRWESDATATKLDADVWAHELKCDAQSGERCLRRYQGTGGAYGVALGARAERRLPLRGVPIRVGLEAGVLLYRSWWNVRVTQSQDCADPTYTCGAMFHFDHATGEHWTPFYGANVCWGVLCGGVRRNKDVYAQGRATSGDNKGDVGAVGKGLTEWSLAIVKAF